ncbi:MAG TPA: NADH-quinone oxidoreductase subunit NuoF [Elusimicrobiota bacterium]|nr:NADH-quinone oxidoreductase subunit NuoF [Elusimicrobiota bacterium]
MTPAASPAKAAGPLSEEQLARLKDWTKRFPHPSMGLLEALRDVQAWFRHIPLEVEPTMAELFRVPLHQVREVVTFYPFFTTRPAAKHRIAVCRNLSCTLAGCGKALSHLGERLGVPQGKVTDDGLFEYHAVECLGACEHGPALSVNDELLGSATPERLDQVLDAGRSGKPLEAPASVAVPTKPVPPGSVILTRFFHEPELHRLATYKRLGGYAAWEKAKGMAPAAIIDEVKKSNLRGLGGAGFPVGMKWGTVPLKKDRDVPHFLVANADESEPGCFKDRVLMERNPHALVEGLMIAARAVEADHVFVFIRGEYSRQLRILQAAAEEARGAGLLEKPIQFMRGADAYISGCDTALLETMEGKKAWPRQPPPFPTIAGVMGCPTVVNNVETLMMVPSVLTMGADSFAGLGAPKSGGTAVFSVSGHVERPGVYELPMGTPLMDLIALAGGVRGGKKLKAVIPGGTSTPILTAEEAGRAKMDFDSMRQVGSFLGAGGVIVLDESVDMAETLFIIERFLAHESCGQCTPCREGSGWTTRILERLLAGGGAPDDPANLLRIGDNITGKVICALGDTVGAVARAYLTKFPDDFKRKVARG